MTINQRLNRLATAILLAIAVLLTKAPSYGQSTESSGVTQPPVASNNFPDLTFPETADAAALQQIVAKAKQARPTNGQQYKAQQMAIKSASAKLVQLLKKDSTAYQQAEIDSITASVALLTFFNDKDQATLIQQLSDFLKGRKQLSLQDVQTGIFAAGMLELQPQKQPAHDVYTLLNELLEPDKREEMQALRINIQASIRRLELLGRKMEFQAKAIDGKSIKIDDFAGKFALIHFFADWSKPSLAELQLIKNHHAKYASKGLIVVGVCLDQERSVLDRIIKESQITWPIIHDNADNVLERLQLKYGVSALPTGLLLNKEGTVISLEARSDELTRLMQMLFESPTPAAAPAPAGNNNATASPTPAPSEDGKKAK